MSASRVPAAGLLFVGLLTLLTSSASGGETQPRRPVVVELYTSQGCSSCPPADALLGQLASRKNILAMSLPVTYWDMLGWRDTLATEANTQRQKAYAKQLGRGGVFTPEIIVDGMTDIIGSREQSVEGAIAAKAADVQAVPIRLAANHEQIRVAVGGAPQPVGAATIWLFGILPQASVSIHNGENDGRTLTYRNVVRHIRAVGNWKGQPVNLTLARTEAGAPRESIAVVLQQGGYGRVIGAAFIDRPTFSAMR
ncbi:MAG TPA: DUF1223 domain-containing protein [Rhizomicrobium sp.]|nr:DUF1223 domain-containing protein [Rhizomicrobium sp.]